MKKEDFNLDSLVTVKIDEQGTTVDGTIKGVNEDCNGNVQVEVEYLAPTTSQFKPEDVTLK